LLVIVKAADQEMVSGKVLGVCQMMASGYVEGEVVVGGRRAKNDVVVSGGGNCNEATTTTRGARALGLKCLRSQFSLSCPTYRVRYAEQTLRRRQGKLRDRSIT
jgi:hypothetical protein